MIISSTEPSQQSQAILRALQVAVSDCLEKKRRLSQYEVVWQDGQIVRIGVDASEFLHQHVESTASQQPSQGV
jgi:hypothetical protein